MQIRNVFLLVFALCFSILSFGVKAHEIRPSIADLDLNEEGGYTLSIQTNAEALLTGIGSEHEDTDEARNADAYNALRALAPEALSERVGAFQETFLSELVFSFDGVQGKALSVTIEVPPVGDLDLARDSIIKISGEMPDGARNFEWAWPAKYGASVVRVNLDGVPSDEGYSAYLSVGEKSEQISLQSASVRGFWEIVREYIHIGFTHILPLGLDHILFVVGLFLLSTKFSPLLWQITAFTVAHTVTLALGILGYVSISPAIVEPLIAASIVYVAVENIMTNQLSKWRPLIVFGFGLLHGLGFAGVLQEIGLSSSHFVTGLIAFNIGVELGQLAVIAICFITVGYWFGKKPWYRQYITTPASIGIALIASWWVYERVFLG